MEIRIIQRFGAPPQKVWDILRNPDFEKEVRADAQLQVQILKNEEKNGVLHEKFRITSPKELPALMRSATGVDKLSYDQEMESDVSKFTTRWRVVPAFAQDKVKCEGVSKLVLTPEGCERRIEGELKVNVPFVGGKIEQHIVTELESGYNRAADVLRRWLQK